MEDNFEELSSLYLKTCKEMITIFKKIHFPFGLGKAQMFILKKLFENENGLHPGEIQPSLAVSSSRIANALKDLEEKKYIKRSTDKKDKRKTIVNITEKGKKIVLETDKLINSYLIETIKALGVNDFKEYLKLVQKINAIELEIVSRR